MNIKKILASRQMGKTTILLKMSEAQNIPILCTTGSAKAALIERAEKEDIRIPEPISVGELGHTPINFRKVLVDDAEYVLEAMLSPYNLDVDTLTMTLDNTIG